MKIFTNKGFREELERRRKVEDEKSYWKNRIYELNERIDHLECELEKTSKELLKCMMKQTETDKEVENISDALEDIINGMG